MKLCVQAGGQGSAAYMFFKTRITNELQSVSSICLWACYGLTPASMLRAGHLQGSDVIMHAPWLLRRA